MKALTDFPSSGLSAPHSTFNWGRFSPSTQITVYLFRLFLFGFELKSVSELPAKADPAGRKEALACLLCILLWALLKQLSSLLAPSQNNLCHIHLFPLMFKLMASSLRYMCVRPPPSAVRFLIACEAAGEVRSWK